MSDQISTDQIGARLRRIEGQVRGIYRMLDEGRSCEDVITQLMAVRSGIDSAGALILDEHLGRCTGDGVDAVEQLRESMRLWWRFGRGAGATGAADEEIGARSPLPSE